MPEATPTPVVLPTPGSEAVFANFSFQKEKFIKENMVSSFGKAFLEALTWLAGSWGGAPHKKRFAVAYLVVRRERK